MLVLPTPGGPTRQMIWPFTSGASGGGLFDREHRLVGVMTFKFRSGTDLQLATLSVGFADGIPVDYARGQGPILVHGRRTRFLELCMDQSIIDVTGIPCKVGDEVTLIGQDGDERISVYSIEKRTGRTFDALLTFISDRIARICR